MNLIESLKDSKTLILAESSYSPVLYGLRKRFPELDFHFLNEEEFLDQAVFSYPKNPLPFLIASSRYDYASSKKVMRLLRVIDLTKDEELSSLEEGLRKEGYIEKNPVDLIRLKQYDRILLLEEKHNDELHHVLSRVLPGKKPEEIILADLGYKPVKQENLNFRIFPNKFEQYFYLFGDLTRRLKNGEDPASFRILGKDSGDCFYFGMCQDLFSLPLSYSFSRPLLSAVEVKDALSRIHQERKISFPEGLDEKSPLGMLKTLSEFFALEKLDDFDKAYGSLSEISSSTTIDRTIGENGIQATTKVEFLSDPDHPDRIYYVTDFDSDNFYSVSKDDNVRRDEDLVRLGANPSYRRTQMDQDLKRNFLLYTPTVFVSRAKRHLGDKLFDSPLLKEEAFLSLVDGKEEKVSWEKKVVPIDFGDAKGESFLEEGLYPRKAREVLLRYLAQSERIDSTLLSSPYDHSCSGITGIPLPKSLGVTRLTDYADCPFFYYLQDVLQLEKDDPDDDFTSARFGTFEHAILEDVYRKDFDFEKAYQEKGLPAYKAACEEEEYTPTESDYAGLEIAKPWIKRVVDKLHDQLSSGSITDYASEEKTSLDVASSSGRKYRLSGRVDKIVYTKGTASNYYTIIDYKTGSCTFDFQEVFLGKSLQLPIYALSTMENASDYGVFSTTEEGLALNRGMVFGGFGIQRVFQNDPRLLQEDNIRDLGLRGLSYGSLDYVNSFDPSAINEKNEIGDGDYLQGNLSFTDDDSRINKKILYSRKDLYSDCYKALDNILSGMEKEQYPIAPLSKAKKKISELGENAPVRCHFCTLQDVCHFSLEDIRYVGKDIAQHFVKAPSEKKEKKPAKKGEKK